MSRRLIAHLAHVEILTPKLEESARFFKDLVGMEESGSDGQSIYFRGWGEWHYHSLQLTAAEEPGLGHIGWRAWSPEDLNTAVANLESAGAGVGWFEGSTGHGPAFRYRGPGGHLHEIFWEVDRYEPSADMRSTYPDRPQRFMPRGVAPRMIDHVTVLTEDTLGDARWYEANLGSTFTEWTVLDEADIPVFAMTTNNEKSHDLGLLRDQSGIKGRLHHFALWVDTSEALQRAADLLLDSGVEIETGPGRHGMGEQEYLYLKEPGGNRLEINTGGYRLYVPDWQPTKWTPAEGSQDFYRNVPMPDSMLDGTPKAPVKGDAEIKKNYWKAASVH